MSFTLVSTQTHSIHLSTSSCDRFNINVPAIMAVCDSWWMDGTQAFNTMNYSMSIYVFDAVNQIIHIRYDYFWAALHPLILLLQLLFVHFALGVNVVMIGKNIFRSFGKFGIKFSSFYQRLDLIRKVIHLLCSRWKLETNELFEWPQKCDK